MEELALFLMNLARVANSSVVCVSAADACAGLMFAIMTVLALPPSESCGHHTNISLPVCLGFKFHTYTLIPKVSREAALSRAKTALSVTKP